MSPLPSRYGSEAALVVRAPVEGLGQRVRALGPGRALIVTDAGLLAAGHVDRVQRSLEAAGLAVAVHDGARPDPGQAEAEACAAAAAGWRAEVLVAVGGGSCVDTAKAGALLLARGGAIEEARGFQRRDESLLPIVAVPTTAGAGSEVQSFALISRRGDKVKLACGAPGLMPRIAWLDPTLCLSAPVPVSLAAGLDALAHAVEAAVCTVSTEASRAHAEQAAGLIWRGLERSLQVPADLEARADVLYGATMAGQAIEASMLGAAHATANPLTARWGVEHGLAVGLMLPHVLRFNAALPEVRARYAQLGERLGLAEELADAVQGLLDRWRVGERLLGPAAAWEREGQAWVADALQQWTGGFNPRPLDAAAVAGLYRAALGA